MDRDAIVEAALDAIVGVDPNGVIAFANATARRWFGEGIDGRTLEEVAGAPAVASALATLREGGAAVRVRVIVPAERGRERHLELLLSPVLRDGALVGATAIARDIGDHVRVEADLDKFAYAASHDLQEPLRMVSSFTQLLAERYRDAVDDRGREYIAFAQDGAKRMRQLLLDLLAYSRVRTRGEPLRPTDVKACVDRAVREVAAGSTIACDVHARVMGDPTQLQQLFTQLIGNAIKFHGEEPPRIVIAAERSGAEWSFSVRDNGIGIAAEHAERVFEIFERLHTRDRYPGSGIGLALCRRIVDRHEGALWVESDGATGSTFRFTLRAAD